MGCSSTQLLSLLSLFVYDSYVVMWNMRTIVVGFCLRAHNFECNLLRIGSVDVSIRCHTARRDKWIKNENTREKKKTHKRQHKTTGTREKNWESYEWMEISALTRKNNNRCSALFSDLFSSHAVSRNFVVQFFSLSLIIFVMSVFCFWRTLARYFFFYTHSLFIFWISSHCNGIAWIVTKMCMEFEKRKWTNFLSRERERKKRLQCIKCSIYRGTKKNSRWRSLCNLLKMSRLNHCVSHLGTSNEY